MTRDEQQPIHLIRTLENASRGDNGHALLHEIVNLLGELLERDEPSHIDLQAIPLGPEDMEMLAQSLGEGEINAEITDIGTTHISATGIPGVWWVVQTDESEQVIGEFIEINYCPEALIAPTEDIRDGREALKARLFEAGMKRKRRTTPK
ncbi:MAG: hydrogenase expression/formation protein [Gammaproteobacteria bacterium]|nr:hydrogenase expression/formation protein [Gammaproteobacteria bacterium]MCW8959439.1 hydrogenase expression/formation protein [Gammaproteobacteria bacterium]MCW8993318.1 hydrogenase expression/formation protein [Gammaproteobacteria bacterium]